MLVRKGYMSAISLSVLNDESISGAQWRACETVRLRRPLTAASRPCPLCIIINKKCNHEIVSATDGGGASPSRRLYVNIALRAASPSPVFLSSFRSGRGRMGVRSCRGDLPSVLVIIGDGARRWTVVIMDGLAPQQRRCYCCCCSSESIAFLCELRHTFIQKWAKKTSFEI